MIKILFAVFLCLVVYRYAFAMVGVDASEFLKAWHAAKHWQGVTAGVIGVAMMTSFGKMQPLPNRHMSQARAFGVVVVSMVMVGFFLGEYWFVVEAALEGLKALYHMVAG